MSESTTTGPRPATPGAATEDATIRPFQVSVPEEDLDDRRRRIGATNWPEKETVADQSQGVPLEARLNALPQFITEIDGLEIHFIHVRSKHEDALPLIVKHGWPGSIIEQLKIIDPLVNPTAHGASAADAFDVVVPSSRATGSQASRRAPVGAPSAWAKPGRN